MNQNVSDENALQNGYNVEVLRKTPMNCSSSNMRVSTGTGAAELDAPVCRIWEISRRMILLAMKQHAYNKNK